MCVHIKDHEKYKRAPYHVRRQNILWFLQKLHGRTPNVVLVTPLRIIIDIEAKRIPQADVDLKQSFVDELKMIEVSRQSSSRQSGKAGIALESSQQSQSPEDYTFICG